MAIRQRRNFIELQILEEIRVWELDEDQEKKKMSLPELMVKHYHNFKLNTSINKTLDVWAFLYIKYGADFNKKQIKGFLATAKKQRQRLDNLIMLQRLREEEEEAQWQLEVERTELCMEFKERNEFPDYEGHCDDWDTNTHWGVYEPECRICDQDFEDEEEFLEMECTCLVHTQCLMDAASGEDFLCTFCGGLNHAR